MRLPNSSAAWIQAARAVPTPWTLVRVATGCDASRRSDPRHVERISWPMPRLDRPSDPDPSRIASSSLELSACAPWLLSRSRGRSAAGSSRIANDTLSPCFGFQSVALGRREAATRRRRTSSARCRRASTSALPPGIHKTKAGSYRLWEQRSAEPNLISFLREDLYVSALSTELGAKQLPKLGAPGFCVLDGSRSRRDPD